MQISFQDLRNILKSTGIEVYRDEAPANQSYPYIIYEFVNEQHRRTSNKVIADMPLYQIAYITKGIETELKTLKDALNAHQVPYEPFRSMPYDENDDTITQFITYVRCINE